jgi:hypothetical protein
MAGEDRDHIRYAADQRAEAVVAGAHGLFSLFALGQLHLHGLVQARVLDRRGRLPGVQFGYLQRIRL